MFRKKNSCLPKCTSDDENPSEDSPFKSTQEFCDKSRDNIELTRNSNHFLGIFYCFLTSLSTTLIFVFVQMLTYMNAAQLSMICNASVWALCLPIAVFTVKDVLGAKEDRLMLVARSLVVGTSTYANTTAVKYLPLAEAAVIISTLPAVTTLVARIFLKEPCGIIQSTAIALTFLGVLLYVRLPEFLSKRGEIVLDSTYIIGLASAVGTVLLLSVNFVVLRNMRHVHYSVLLTYSGFIAMIENGTISFATSHFSMPQCGWDQFMIILCGLLSFSRYVTNVLSLQVETAGIVSVLKASMDIILSMIFQVIFFGLKLDIYKIAGGGLLIFSLTVIGLKKWLIALPVESKTKKRFKVISIVAENIYKMKCSKVEIKN